MMEFLFTLLLFLLAFAGLAAGALAGRPGVTGSCGGLDRLPGIDSDCGGVCHRGALCPNQRGRSQAGPP